MRHWEVIDYREPKDGEYYLERAGKKREYQAASRCPICAALKWLWPLVWLAIMWGFWSLYVAVLE